MSASKIKLQQSPLTSLAPKISHLLQKWFEENRRPLPWRGSRDPYRIWISEIMLQQTTVTAVIPYYERFLVAFPDVHQLAAAPESQVLKMWAGLGYYSRARNLHKAAKLFSQHGFPKSYQQLLSFPGLGPYTARAVSSFAFSEAVGVVDGNVIRVFSRLFAEPFEWWKNKTREELQHFADLISQAGDPWTINQALMELGATVCTPKSPTCLLCPVATHCQARKQDLVSQFPRPKPKRTTEFWIWTPQVLLKKQKVGLVTNNYAPFLRGKALFPGEARKVARPPKTFDLRHSITHHDIYIQIQRSLKSSLLKSSLSEDVLWVSADQVNPSSLLKKVLQRALPPPPSR